MKKLNLLIFIFLLNIFVASAQLAKVYDEENLDFDREYRDNYLQERNHFADLDYTIVTGGHKLTAKVGGPYYNDYKAINLNNQKKYVFDLIDCDSYERYCTFRINGVPTGKMHNPNEFPNKKTSFRLDEEYIIKIDDIKFDYCGDNRFCSIGEFYHVIDILIDGPTRPACGDGVCEAGETCEEDDCCSGVEAYLDNNEQNCGVCGKSCGEGGNCVEGECVEICPETNKCDFCKLKNIGEICDCNEECDSNICINSKCITSRGKDLSDYPNFLIKDGNLDVTTVVGDKSSSSNVLAQTNIVLSLGNLGTDVKIENKLASEIEDLNQNIISIGNACVNKISAEIMNNPEPCDKDFPKGKGYIKLYKYNDFLHLIVAGHTEVGTKKMAEILANYENYNLKGDIFEIEVEEIESKDSMGQIEEEQEEKTKKIVEKSKETLEEVQEMGEKEPIEKETAEQTEEKEPVSASKETSFIKRIFLWIASLFR